MPSDPASLHPGKGADPYSSTLHFALFEGLVRYCKDKPYELALAKKIDISQDQTCYTFHLKKSFWSNGNHVTAQDFYNSWSQILDSKFPAPNAHLFYPIKNARAVKMGQLSKEHLGLRVVNQDTFEVTLTKPTPYFLKLISFCCFSPYVEGNDEYSKSQFVGNGPFILSSRKLKDHLILHKNPLYHDAGNVRINSVKIGIINDENTALNLFKKGKLDLLGATFTSIPQDHIEELIESGELNSHNIGATNFYCFNTLKAPFNNKKLRQALIISVDRESLVNNIVGKQGSLAHNITPQTVLYDKKPDNRKFNIALAQQYLNEALDELNISAKDLSSTRLLYHNKDLEKRIALSLQQQWQKNLNLNIKLEECEFKVLADRISNKNYTMALCALITQFDDPIAVLERFKYQDNSKNYSGFESKDYIALLEQSELLSDAERCKILAEAQKIVMNAFTMAPIYHFNCLYITSPKISNFFVSNIGSNHLSHITLRKTLEHQEVDT
jgi:oligopeptide transport system substrate-binding protein